jgi:hypothetical protein
VRDLLHRTVLRVWLWWLLRRRASDAEIRAHIDPLFQRVREVLDEREQEGGLTAAEVIARSPGALVRQEDAGWSPCRLQRTLLWIFSVLAGVLVGVVLHLMCWMLYDDPDAGRHWISLPVGIALAFVARWSADVAAARVADIWCWKSPCRTEMP